MRLVKQDVSETVLAFSMDELAMISNALNESLEAIEEWEFKTRMGATQAQVENLLAGLSRLRPPESA